VEQLVKKKKREKERTKEKAKKRRKGAKKEGIVRVDLKKRVGEGEKTK